MPKITIHPSGQTISYDPGKNLLEILLKEKIFVDNPCNGKGICGKCRVKILSADPPAAHPTEEELLKPEERAAGIRLACLTEPRDDIEIELLQKERRHEVLTDGYVPDLAFDCDIIKQVIQIKKPGLDGQMPYEEQIRSQLEDIEKMDALIEIGLDVLSDVKAQPGIMTAVLYKSHKDGSCTRLIQLEEGDTSDASYGVAVDIGTTTVVCALIDLHTGEELANASMINAQKHFGLDVLTRITYELEHPEDGRKKLQAAIVGSINDMIQEICTQAGVSREHIYEITVGANCTMMHMLLNIDASPIGKAPYAPIFVNARDIPARQIGLQAAKGARLYCLPSVSAYIGADIVAGTYVCGLEKARETVLFIDIGTNGEIVLSHNGRLLCCSCAAGPALEGMNIRCGMRAAQGAVEDVHITEEGVKMDVIGGGKPAGICGSGILAAVRELLRTELIRPAGAFIKKDQLDPNDYRFPILRLDGTKREAVLAEETADDQKPLLITQQDVRQVQLAKGAILSGFTALLNKAGLSMEDLDKVMVAGQFGAHLPADSITGTGILPEGVREKITYVGNSSKTGAYMALMSAQVKREMEELAGQMEYMELGATKGYERLFSDCLIFPGHAGKKELLKGGIRSGKDC